CDGHEGGIRPRPAPNGRGGPIVKEEGDLARPSFKEGAPSSFRPCCSATSSPFSFSPRRSSLRADRRAPRLRDPTPRLPRRSLPVCRLPRSPLPPRYPPP